MKKTFILPQGEDSEVIRAQFNARAAQFDQEQEIFRVSIGKGQATDIMMYNTTNKRLETQLQRKYELKDNGQFFSFREITDHLIIKGTSSRYEVLVSWEDGSVHC